MRERKPHELQGEGRMARKRLTSKSDRVTLYVFVMWLVTLVNSKRGSGQFHQANTNIFERNPKTCLPMVLTTVSKTPTMSNTVVLPITKQYHVIRGSQAATMLSCIIVRNFSP